MPDPEPSRDAPLLRCEVEPERDAVRVRPIGSLDMATVPQLQAQVDELRDAGFRHVILDLRDLEFMDSSGLRLILMLDAAARDDGFGFSLTRGSSAVQRVFEITGTADRLPFTDF